MSTQSAFGFAVNEARELPKLACLGFIEAVGTAKVTASGSGTVTGLTGVTAVAGVASVHRSPTCSSRSFGCGPDAITSCSCWRSAARAR